MATGFRRLVRGWRQAGRVQALAEVRFAVVGRTQLGQPLGELGQGGDQVTPPAATGSRRIRIGEGHRRASDAKHLFGEPRARCVVAGARAADRFEDVGCDEVAQYFRGFGIPELPTQFSQNCRTSDLPNGGDRASDRRPLATSWPRNRCVGLRAGRGRTVFRPRCLWEACAMNRLAAATSPYLLQHADNPVDWWPWGEEAFEEARRRDVPVLLSIGYSSCH